MKKTYIAPCMEIVKVQIAGSMLLEASLNLNSETVSGSNALSRRSNRSWNDDEE